MRMVSLLLRSSQRIGKVEFVTFVISFLCLCRRQVDTTPDVSKKGQALVVVMSANGEEVEDVAVQVLSVFGHCNTADKQPTTLLDGLVGGRGWGGGGGGIMTVTSLTYRIPMLHFH